MNYCDNLFQYGISKFSDNINLKSNYITFLIIEMNNAKKALIILNSINKNILSFTINYNIYLCRKLIDKYYLIITEKNCLNEYQINSKDFKDLIEKTILLYYKFMSLLLDCKNKKDNNFQLLNKLGNQIIIKKKEIEKNFNKLIKTKTNNNEIIQLYSEFNKIILNNKDNHNNYQINENNKQIKNNEIDYSNLNTEIFKKNNDLYLIISTNKNNLGVIIDCCINLSKIFGYKKEEIIGKNINILIPEIFHQKHNLIILNYLKNNKLKFIKNLYDKKKFYPDFIEKETFILSKSKFLIPIKLKIFFVQTEKNDFVFIAKILQIIDIKDINISKCCILTDKNLFIKFFTPNCLNYLNLCYNHINSNYCIINNIKQLKRDYLLDILEDNSLSTYYKNIFSTNKSSQLSKKHNTNYLSINSKEKIIYDLIKKKYNKKCSIIWTINEENENNNFEKKGSKLGLNKNCNIKEKKINLYMEIKEIILNEELVGYHFFFSKIYNKVYSDNSKYNQFQNINSDSINSLNFSMNINFNNIKEKNDKKRKLNSYIQYKYLSMNYNCSSNENNKKNLTEIIDNNKEKDKRININKNFIPNSLIYFSFNLNNFSYELSKDNLNYKILIESLKKEALIKINKYKEFFNFIKKVKNNSLISSSKSVSNLEKEEYISDSYYESSSSSMTQISNKKLDLKYMSDIISLKRNNITINNNIPLINKSKTKTLNITKEINYKEKFENKILKNEISNLFNNKINDYYKLNLNNIHFFIYDFNKDMIIEDKKNEDKSQINKILLNIKNDNLIDFGKDENYPILTYKNMNKDIKFNNQIKKENINDKNNHNKNILNNEKLIEQNINKVINLKTDEIPIIKLKMISLISFVILSICGIINLFLILKFYSSIKELIKLYKNSIILRYCNIIGMYYIKELILLNFNISNIVGGEYISFPAKNRTKYILLIAENLKNLYVENQNSLKLILSSTFSFSNNKTKYLSELVFDVDFLFHHQVNKINSDIYSTLLQYNNAFYSLVSLSINLNKTHPDIYNYNHNSYNNYQKAIKTMIDIYSSELHNNIRQFKLSSIFILILYFLIFIFIYLILSIGFISASKKRIEYIKIFYGINENLLKHFITDCQNLINNIRNIKMQEINENDNNEELSEISNHKINNIKYNQNKNSIINNKNANININSFSIDFIYIILLGVFMLINYFYFIYIYLYTFNISNNSLLMTNFFYKLQSFHLNIVDLFNSYRQYIFDENSKINSFSNILEYLEINIKDSYDSITSDVSYIQNYINKYISFEGKIQEIYNKNLCSFYFTDYFNSIDECNNKYENILKYNFIIFVSHFVQEIRVLKNILKYLINTGKIRGNLNEYNIKSWIDDDLIPKKNNTSNSTSEIMFRLNLYNNETLHNNPNVLFLNIILPYFETNRKVLLEVLIVNGNIYNFIIFCILYLVVILLFFLSFWIPLISYLNNIIYKAKNMISIIPMNILIYQNNLNSLNEESV